METPSRSCRWVRRRLPLLVGGELARVERRRVGRHLIGCASCRERRTASAESLAVLQEIAVQGPAGLRPSDNPLSVWPALARQIRESRHEVGQVWSWKDQINRSAVRYGLAASLILGLTWFWSARPVGFDPTGGAGRVTSTTSLVRVPPASVATPSVEPLPIGTDQGLTPTMALLDKWEVPAAASELRGLALPTGEESRTVVPPRPGSDPFQPPLTLRLDYDLDRGTLAGPVVRDTQRAY